MPASKTTDRSPVPPALYSRELLLAFSGAEYTRFLATDGRQLRPRLSRAFELARLARGMSVLDIGCGRGEIALHAARAGARVTAVDFSDDCLQLTVSTLALGTPADRARAHLMRADATALPVADRSIDRVFCLDVVEHLQSWQLRQTLREIRRVLAPDGYTVIHTLPNRWALDVGYPLLRRLWHRLPANPRSAYERRVHVNELDPVRLSRALNEAGLRARLWLENQTVEQARWRAGDPYADLLRQVSYPLLRRCWVAPVARLLMGTPLRLIFGNDLFAIAWPRPFPTPAVSWPSAWSERIVTFCLAGD